MKDKSHDYVTLLAVLFAVILGAVVRFYPVLLSNYPLNDGGLFFQMTQDVLNQNFSLPVYTSYNGSSIPFGYPPLAFYLMAFMQKVLHFRIIDQLHFLPALISTLCIPAFYFLSRSITSSKEKSVFAVYAYALIPGSYLWLIMGGGITRSLGLLFGILSILCVWEMFNKPRISNLLLSVLFCSLTILSHLGIAWFVFLTSIMIIIHFGINKKRSIYALLTIIGIFLFTLPWWMVIIQRHGISSFFNAIQTSDAFDFSIMFFNFTGEPFIQILAVIALFGLFAEIARRKFFLFAWLLLIAILSARGSPRLASLPGSMLFGSGVVWVLVPGLVSYTGRVLSDNRSLAEIMQEGITKLALGIILFFALFSALAVPILGLVEIRSLSPNSLQAMEWISQNTSSESQFIILTGEDWKTDPESEWFPALTGRISTATVQGSEWLPDRKYFNLINNYKILQSCIQQDYSCVELWAEESKVPYSHIYISKPIEGEKGNYPSVLFSLEESDQLQLIFENPSVTVYKVIKNQ